MRKITFFLFGMLLWTASICGQNIPAGFVKSFTTIAPDTVVQGVSFGVRYKLVSRGWDGGGRPLSGGSFILSDTRFDVYDGAPYSTLMTSATYVCTETGMVELPGMVISVKKKELSTTKRVYVKPHPLYGAEMTLAVKHLRSVGQHEDSVCLKMARAEKHFWLFDDVRNGNFCIVAKKELWPLLKQPVLAYSTESAMNYDASVGTYRWVADSYADQIEALLAGGDGAGSGDGLKYTARATEVAPMLGGLRWNQRAPYNKNAPTLNGKKLVVGCVPLSMAMVMNYHKWPEQGQSKCHYLNGGNIYSMDFSAIRPQWSMYKDYYQEGDSATIPDDLTRMLLFLGLSIDADFSDEATSAKYINVKPVLCNNLGYSGKMQYHYTDLTDNDIISLIYRELDNKRPCILSGGSHSFVCDGRSGDFVHYNMGWGGWRNGYYQLKIGDYAKQKKMLVMPKAIVCGIEPQRSEYAKEVTLKDAGTLEAMFSEEEKERVTNLKITGPLNSADIRFIRKMAGAIDNCLFSDEWKGGSLRSLDLSAANIVKDNNPYLVTPAQGGWTSTSYMGNGSQMYVGKTKHFQFSSMTEREWKDFKRTVGAKQDGVFYTRTDDNKYWSHYVCQKGVIGRYMFKECTSLNTLILPEKTREIQDNAFFGCSSLVTMRIPQKTDMISNRMFAGCVSLMKVELPKSISNYREQSENSSPYITIERY